MFKKITLANIAIALFTVILLAPIQVSYADGTSITVNVPNANGSYTPVVIHQSGNGFVGPQGEYYPKFPSVAQLRIMYGAASAPQVNVITIAPPALPVYVQPDPPDPSYIWTPGHWRYDHFFMDYYWVPGTWVAAPAPGLLWTPGYWYWRGGNFVFSDGYWGPHIGFYGGINYGFGYEGHGFYRHHGEEHSTNNTSSFNGGPGGVKAQPTPEERVAMKEKHTPATAEQKKHVQMSRQNPALRASANHGKPAIAATAKPGVFKGKGVVAAKQAGAFYNKTKAVNPKSAASHGLVKKPVARKPAAKKPVVKRPKPKVPQANEGNPQVKNIP
jgi:hypothetical protein